MAFRSVRRPDADEARLEEFDERAHREASRAKGFIHYYKGPLPTAARACRSASGRREPTPAPPPDDLRTSAP